MTTTQTPQTAAIDLTKIHIYAADGSDITPVVQTAVWNDPQGFAGTARRDVAAYLARLSGVAGVGTDEARGGDVCVTSYLSQYNMLVSERLAAERAMTPEQLAQQVQGGGSILYNFNCNPHRKAFILLQRKGVTLGALSGLYADRRDMLLMRSQPN